MKEKKEELTIDYGTERARAIREVLHLSRVIKKRACYETEAQINKIEQRVFHLREQYNL